MRFVLEMNTLALETSVLKMHVQALATPTQLATSDFQAEFFGEMISVVTAAYL